jgi:hypothetical protein
MNPSGIRPGRVWYLLPVLIFILSCVLVPVITLVRVLQRKSIEFQMAVPGRKEFEIVKPGNYVLWNETRTMFEGRSFSVAAALPPGVHVELRKADEMKLIRMNTTLDAITSSDTVERRSVGYFEVPDRGKYVLVVDGEFPQRVFSFGKSVLDEKGIILATIVFAGFGLVASSVILLLIFIWRRSALSRVREG